MVCFKPGEYMIDVDTGILGKRKSEFSKQETEAIKICPCDKILHTVRILTY